MDLEIEYRDADGNVTKRRISDPYPIEYDCIDAHCQLKTAGELSSL